MKRVKVRVPKRAALMNMCVGIALVVLSVVLNLSEFSLFFLFIGVVGIGLSIAGAGNLFMQNGLTRLDVVVYDEWQEGMPLPRIAQVRQIENLRAQRELGHISSAVYEQQKAEILKQKPRF